MRFGDISRTQDDDDGIDLSLNLFAESGNIIETYRCNIEKEMFCDELQAVHLLIADDMDVLIDKSFKCVTTAERYATDYLNKLITRLKNQSIKNFKK